MLSHPSPASVDRRPRRKCVPGASAAALCLALAVQVAWAADFDCVIDPRQVIEVRSPVEGLIEKITVDRGDFVTRGQLLVQLDAAVERASTALALQRAQLEGAVRSGESRFEYSSKKHGRQEELFKQNFISAQARDEAATERKLAESELKEAMDNRRVADLEYKRQNEVLRLKTITSPLNGVVMERLMHPGEVAEAGVGRKPILKVADIDTLHVEVILPVEAYGRIKQGSKADVMPDAPVGGKYQAVVTVVDRVFDAASGTFGVRLELPNRQRKLPAGMRCKASFPSIGDDVVPRSRGALKTAPQRPAAPAAK